MARQKLVLHLVSKLRLHYVSEVLKLKAPRCDKLVKRDELRHWLILVLNLKLVWPHCVSLVTIGLFGLVHFRSNK
mgnify:CR=1 FL=1